MVDFFSLLCVFVLHSSLALAWDLLPRDNTTGTDAINVLRCMSFNGVDNSTRVGVSHDEFLVILLNSSTGDLIADTGIICDRSYGFKLQIDYYWSDHFDDNMDELGTIGNVIEAIHEVTGINRMRTSGPFSLGSTTVFPDYREGNAWLSM